MGRIAKPLLVQALFALFLSGTYAQTFYKILSSPSFSQGGCAVAPSIDSGVIVGGFRGDSAMVVRMDGNANPIWTKTFDTFPGLQSEVSFVKVTSDSMIIGLGHSSQFSEQIVARDAGFWFKMDMNGNLLWIHRETNTEPIVYDEIDEISPTTYQFTKNYFQTGGTYADIGLVRVDAATGAITFDSPQYNITTNPYIDDIASTVDVPGQGTYACGRIYVDGGNPGSMRPYFSRFNPNGTLAWTNYYLYPQFANARMYGTEIFDIGSGLIAGYTGNRFGTAAVFSLGAFRTDYNGTIQWAFDYDLNTSSTELGFTGINVPGGILLHGSCTLPGGNQDTYILSVDTNGVVQWARSYGDPLSTEITNHMSSSIAYHQNGIWFTGMKQTGTSIDLTIARTDMAGNISCFTSQVLPVTTTPLAVFQGTQQNTSIANPIAPGPGAAAFASPNAADCPLPAPNLGPNISSCTPVLLNATTPGASTYLWQNGSTNPTLTASTPGTYIVTIGAGCCFKSDTIVVQTGALNTNLPAVGGICPGGTALLDPGPGYTTYLWSTNATTQTITVSMPGTYTVTVTDPIGCTGIDTIILSPASNPSPNLGPNQNLCAGSTVTLNPGLPGMSYQWSNSLSTPTITVSAGGTYYVTVTNASGCTGVDSVQLNPVPNPIVNLGPDQNVCAGASAVFNAGPGFSTYTWSTSVGTPSISTSIAGPYSVTVSDGNGCTDADTANLIIVPAPQVNLGPNITLCAGSNQTLNAGNPGASYLWSNGATTQTISVGTPNTYSVTVTNATGCTGSSSVQIAIPSPMALSFTATPQTCLSSLPDGTAGVSVSGGTAPYTYLWSNGQTGPFITGLTAGTYAVTVTDLSQCTVTGSVTVAPPNAPTIVAGPDASFCAGAGGAAISALPSGGTPGYWLTWWCQSGNCGLSNINGLNPIANPTSTQWYYVQATDTSGCLSNIDSVLVTVLPLPVVDAGPDVVICGDSAPCVVLNPSISGAPGPYSFLWMPSSGLNDPTILNPCARPDTTTIYTLVTTAGNGCASAFTTTDTLSSVTVHVNPVPLAHAGPDIDLCLLDSAMLQALGTGAGPAYAFEWSPNTGLSNPTLTNPLASPPATTIYSLVVWSNGCPSYADSVQVRVHTLPTIDAGWDREICPGDTAQLDAQAGGDSTATYSFLWMPGISLSDSSAEDPLASPSQSTTYQVQAISNFGCRGPWDSTLVTVIPAPVADAGPNLLLCSGDSVQLLGGFSYTTTDTAPTTQIYFAWTPAASLSDSNLLQPLAWPSASLWYHLEVRFRTCLSTDSVLVSVGALAIAQAGADTLVICAQDSIQLLSNGSVGAQANWSPPIGLSDPNAFNPMAAPASSTTYSLTIDQGGCNSQDSVTVLVLPRPEAAFTHSGLSGCSPMAVDFLDASQGALNYIWSFGDGSPVYNGPHPQHTYSQPGVYPVSLIVQSEGACADTALGTLVTVYENPVAEFSTSPDFPVELSLPATALNFQNQSTNAVSSTWDFGDGLFSSDLHPFHAFQQTGTYFVTLLVENAAGCQDQVTHGPFVVVEPELFIPNVFSPDGDGVNDDFLVEYSGSQPYNVTILDRWGSKLFVGENKTSGWKGDNLNGEPVPDGVYFYLVKVGDREFVGNVTLLR